MGRPMPYQLVYDPIRAYMDDISRRYDRLRAGNPVVAVAHSTGENLNLSPEETVKLVAVAVGEAYELLAASLVEREERSGCCVINIDNGGKP